MNKLERLLTAYDYLRNQGIAHTKVDVASAMGATPQNVSAAFKGNERCLTKSFVQRFYEAYKDIFNLDWLQDGEGEMLKSNSNDVRLEVAEAERHFIPFFDTAAFECGPEGFTTALQDFEADAELVLPVPAKGVMFAVRAHGRSMINVAEPSRSIGDNSVVVLRKVNDPSAIRWGEVYALATDDGCIIKKVMPAGDGQVRCVSFNSDEYPDFYLTVGVGGQVHDLAEVVAVLNIF